MIVTLTNPTGLHLTCDTDTGRWAAPGNEIGNRQCVDSLNLSGLPAPGPHDTPVSLARQALSDFGYTGIVTSISGEPTGAEDAGEDCFAGSDAPA